jgi:hypothetical protein
MNREEESVMSVAAAAKLVYEREGKVTLEQSNRDDFVAIESVSRSHFVSKSFS